MSVDANGNWEIDVHQPPVAEGGGEDVPLKFSGDAIDDYVAVARSAMRRQVLPRRR